MPEDLIQYKIKGYMGAELTQLWSWQQGTTILRDQGWGLRRNKNWDNRSFLRRQTGGWVAEKEVRSPEPNSPTTNLCLELAPGIEKA